MKKVITLILLLTNLSVLSQVKQKPIPSLERPKLVVGIMVDQMRWDFLYRYNERYSQTGFKRMLSEGFTCENTLIPYIPTITACGHSSVYTGSVPAINGIIGNNWYVRETGQGMYCVKDTNSKTVGSTTEAAGDMSPKNLMVTTVTDELRLATNFQSKVIGVALKDRGSILPAGKTGNAAYWYDVNTGNWITSTYYMNDLPEWVKKFNEKHLPDVYYKQNWNTLYPIGTYKQSTSDNKSYEGTLAGQKNAIFPHQLADYAGNNYGEIATTPYGNSMTLEMAKAAIENEKLGQNTVTDFLAVSFSSTDYVGHRFGPNSVETEDTYLRLDKEISDLFQYLDDKIGKGKYLAFLTADHGVMHAPGFSQENKLPGGLITQDFKKIVNAELETKFGLKNMVSSVMNEQFYLNRKLIQQSGKNLNEVKEYIIEYVKQIPGVSNALDLNQIGVASLPQPIKEMAINGFNPKRSGDIQVILDSGYMTGEGRSLAATHGLWNPYDAHIPFVLMGWHIKHGKTNKPTFMTDISPTIAALLHIQMPSGCVGKVVTEVTE